MGSSAEGTIINFTDEIVGEANFYDCVRKMKDYFIVTTEDFGKAPVEDLLKPVLHWTHCPRLVVRVHPDEHFKVETVLASTPHLLFPREWVGGEKTVFKKTGLNGVKLIYECNQRADTYTLESALSLSKKLLLHDFPNNPLPLGLCQDACFIQFQDISSEISSIFGFVVPQIDELTFRGTFQFSDDSNQFDTIFASIVKPDVQDEHEMCESDYSAEVECVNTQMNAVKINDNNFYKEQRSLQASDCEPISVPNASKFMKSKETDFSASLVLSWDKLKALVSTGIDIASVIAQIEANKIDHNNIVNGKMQKQQGCFNKKPEDANGGFFNQLTCNENIVVNESKTKEDDESLIKSDKTLLFERGSESGQSESSLLKQRPSYQKTFVPKKGEKRHEPMLIALNSSSQWNLGDVLAAAILSHAYTPKSNRKNVACGTKIVSAADANGEFDFMVGGPTVYSYEDCYHKFTDEHELTMGLLGRMPVNEAAGVRLGTAGLCWAIDGLWANHILVLKTATELDEDAAPDENEVPPDHIRKIAAQIYFQTYNRLIRPIDELVQGKIDMDNSPKEVELLQRVLSLGISPSQNPDRSELPVEQISRFRVCVHIAAQYLGKYIDTQVRLKMLQGFRDQLQKEMKQAKSPIRGAVSEENGASHSKSSKPNNAKSPIKSAVSEENGVSQSKSIKPKEDFIDKWLHGTPSPK